MKLLAIFFFVLILAGAGLAQSGGDKQRDRVRLQDPENCGGKLRDRDRIHLQIHKGNPVTPHQFKMKNMVKAEEGYNFRKKLGKTK